MTKKQKEFDIELYEGIKINDEKDGPILPDPDEPLVKVYSEDLQRVC